METKPGIIVFEAPEWFVRDFGSTRKTDLAGDAQFSARTFRVPISTGLAAAIVATCGGMRLKWEAVSPSTWRKSFLGQGRWTREAAKSAAVEQCRREKIAVKNHDQAEAAGIAVWARFNSQLIKKEEAA